MFSPNSVHGVKHGGTSTLGASEDHTMNFCFLGGCFSPATEETAFVKLSISVPTGWKPWSSSPGRDTEARFRAG